MEYWITSPYFSRQAAVDSILREYQLVARTGDYLVYVQWVPPGAPRVGPPPAATAGAQDAVPLAELARRGVAADPALLAGLVAFVGALVAVWRARPRTSRRPADAEMATRDPTRRAAVPSSDSTTRDRHCPGGRRSCRGRLLDCLPNPPAEHFGLRAHLGRCAGTGSGSRPVHDRAHRRDSIPALLSDCPCDPGRVTSRLLAIRGGQIAPGGGERPRFSVLAALRKGRGLLPALLSACFLNAILQGQLVAAAHRGRGASSGLVALDRQAVAWRRLLRRLSDAPGGDRSDPAALPGVPRLPDMAGAMARSAPRDQPRSALSRRPGGAVLLLALIRWRVAEGRLLAALACVPQTIGLYEALPLFLIPTNRWQGYLLAALSYLAAFAQAILVPRMPGASWEATMPPAGPSSSR